MSNARHTPEVGALVQKHIDERTVMEAAGNWNHSHALRQVKELLALADSLETQRDAALEREQRLREALDWISKIALLNYEQDTKLRADGARTLKRIGERADAALAAKGER